MKDIIHYIKMFGCLVALILITFPLSAKDAPDFIALKKNWGKLDSFTITKSSDIKHTAEAIKGKVRQSRNLYMITPEKPELLLWIFHGYKQDGDPYKQSPEIFIKNLGLKELSAWHNALVVIVDSGESLYAYNPDNGLPELQVYCAIYDKLVSQYGILPAVLAGVSSGAEGAVKFAPFVGKLNSLIGISGTYDFDSLAPGSGEYKIHLKEYGSSAEWKYEQPVRLFHALKCRIILLSEEKSVYRSQAETAGRLQQKKVEFIEEIGKGKSHDWDFWGSSEVKRILQTEVQAAGEHRDPDLQD